MNSGQPDSAEVDSADQAGTTVWQQSSSRGWIGILGLPFLLVGGYMLLLPFLSSHEAPSIGMQILVWLVGLIFFTFGFWLTFEREGIVIDPAKNGVTEWWGMLVPIRKSVRPMAKFSHVSLGIEIRMFRNGSYKVYALRLVGDRSLLLGEYYEYLDARKKAEKLAALCKMKLQDDTSGQLSIREHDELNLSLRQRLKKSDLASLDVPRPESIQAEIHDDASSVSVTLPHGCKIDFGSLKRNSNIRNIGTFVIFCVLVTGLAKILVGNEVKNSSPQLIVIGMAVGLFYFWGLPSISAWCVRRFLMGPIQIVATSKQISLEWKTFLGEKTVTLPTHKLEELLLSKPAKLSGMNEVAPILRKVTSRLAESGCAITARSDSHSLTFGSELSYKELRYIHSKILKLVVG